MTPLQSLWQSLESAAPVHDAGWFSRRIHPSATVALYAAIASATHLPGLLLETTASAVPALADYPTSRGFSVRAVNLQSGRDGTVRLELNLAEAAYRDIFAVLAEDVLDAVTAAGTAAGAVQAFVARLRVWQEFMRRRSPEGLNREEQVGLFSELHVLEDFLLDVLPAYDAVRAWGGPLQALHDFKLGNCHMEVKGTAYLPPAHFHVSRLAQLDETLSRPLVLAHCAWNTAALAGTALPDLVNRLRTRFANADAAALSLFNDALVQVGYLDMHATVYQPTLYVLSALRFFSVQDGFPRLRIGDMPDGITDCSYEVDLNACQPFAMSAATIRNLVLGNLP